MPDQRYIDLNSDVGEVHPINGDNHDAEIMPFISSCNICCGFHSSDAQLIYNTVQTAIKYKLAIGAHPSYRDRKNFGRKFLKQDPDTLMADILYQVGAVKTMVEQAGSRLNHVKAHGALYHYIQNDREIAIQYLRLLKSIDDSLKVVGMPGTPLEKVALELNMSFIAEVFADRHYENRTTLRSRSEQGALITEEMDIKKRIEDILQGNILDYYGHTHKITAGTICLHSDTKGSIKLAELIHKTLKHQNISISSNGHGNEY